MSTQLKTVFGSSCLMHRNNKVQNMQASGYTSVSDHTKHHSEILVQELPSLAPSNLYACKTPFWAISESENC